MDDFILEPQRRCGIIGTVNPRMAVDAILAPANGPIVVTAVAQEGLVGIELGLKMAS